MCKIVKLLMLKNPVSHETVLLSSTVLRSNFPPLKPQGTKAIKNISIIYSTDNIERHIFRIKEVRNCTLSFLPNSKMKTVDEKFHSCQIQYRFSKPKSHVLASLRHVCS